MEEMSSISVVTVSYQAVETIERTIQSVLNQNYKRYEYILIDGGSTDGTLELIKHYKKIFSDKGIKYIYISEPDKGIYDAMNKAIQYCVNDWIVYLNATDSFYDNCVLKNVFISQYPSNISCIYGTTVNIKNGISYYKKAYPMKCIAYRAPFVHQALFVKRDVLERYRFDLDYRIAADFDQFIRMYAGGEKFQKIDVVIAKFDMSGISQSCTSQTISEWYRIWKTNNMFNQKRLQRWYEIQLKSKLKQNKFIWILYTNFLKKKWVLRSDKN